MSTNSETYFFRDSGQFDLLRQELLPELIEHQGRSKNLRLWSAGCASGEEPYSLAIIMDILLPKRDGWAIKIIGSDINSIALAKAKRARYRKWSFRETPDALQQRYFGRAGDEWELDERIRNMVSFRSLDLITESFPNEELHDMDLILCRNVFIYFNTETVASVANKLAASLRAGGYLMTAHAELSGIQMPKMRSKLFSTSLVYQRLNISPIEPSPPIVDTPPTEGAPSVPISMSNAAKPSKPNITTLLTMARHCADRAEYDQSEKICYQVLKLDPLAAAPYFLLAQVAQLKGDFQRATEMLEKTLYIEPDNAGAVLELAALHERANNLTKARSLRRAALNLIRALPNGTMIEPYEMTAGEIADWLIQYTST